VAGGAQCDAHAACKMARFARDRFFMPLPSHSQLDDPAAQAAQLIVRVGVFVLATALPLACVVSRRAIFPLMPIGAILVLIGASLAPERPNLRQCLSPLFTPVGLAALFLAAWAALSLAWTPWTSVGIGIYAKTMGTFGLALAAAELLPGHTKTSNLNLLPVGVALAALATTAVALIGPTWMRAPAPTLEASTLPRSIVGLIMLLWPALTALAIRQRRTSAGLLAALTALAGAIVWTPAALAVMGAGALVFWISASAPRPSARAMAAVFALLFVCAPALALAAAALIGRAAAPPPFLSEIPVWASIVKGDGLRLLTGHGFDALSRARAAGLLPAGAPRSLLFEVWYDLGVLGALGAAALTILAYLSAGRASRAVAPFALAALTCGLLFAVTGLATTQMWWITLVSVAGFGFGLVRKGQYRTQRPRVSVPISDPHPSAP